MQSIAQQNIQILCGLFPAKPLLNFEQLTSQKSISQQQTWQNMEGQQTATLPCRSFGKTSA